MKTKTITKFAITGIFTFSLLGCQSLTEVKEAIKEGYQEAIEEQERENMPMIEVTTEEYVEHIGEYQAQVQEEFDVLAMYSTDYSADDYIENNVKQMKVIRTVTNKFRKLIAPENMIDIHLDYLTAMDHIDQGLLLLEKGLLQQDETAFNEGMKEIEEGQYYLNYAFSMLSKEHAVPIGDGTVTSEDLKRLDRLAGIDRDSVLDNLSKDGSELVGAWGFEWEEGVDNVSLVLYADGRYEGYGNGDYPNKDNGMFGYWTYNYKNQTLFFINESQYTDGSLVEVVRPEMTMDVQSFGNDTIQLMDLETLNTFYYKKIDLP
ncbi:MAG: DUF3994 domain-containing protein [Anaerobacillus sp.]|uniref:DUF3994 domain-containing protein n=1 Tax=Anaerobacillus sp. TaxID=1872506 RepID=UPI0039191299